MRGDDLLLVHLGALGEPDGKRAPREPGWARVEAAVGRDLAAELRRALERAREDRTDISALPPRP